MTKHQHSKRWKAKGERSFSEAWKSLSRAEKEQKDGGVDSKYPRFYESGTQAWRGAVGKRKDER